MTVALRADRRNDGVPDSWTVPLWRPGMETQSSQDWFTAEIQSLPRLRNPAGNILGTGATRRAYPYGPGRVQVVDRPGRSFGALLAIYDYLRRIGVRVPRVYQIGLTEDGRPSVIMEQLRPEFWKKNRSAFKRAVDRESLFRLLAILDRHRLIAEDFDLGLTLNGAEAVLFDQGLIKERSTAAQMAAAGKPYVTYVDWMKQQLGTA